MQSISLYGEKAWPITKKYKGQNEDSGGGLPQKAYRLTDRINGERKEYREITSSTTRNFENRQLRWYEHMKKIPIERWTRNMYEWEPKERKGDHLSNESHI